jgi:uncharacterized membrane protein
MDNPILVVFMRYLHIVSALSAVGGMVFLISCMLPSVVPLEDEARKAVVKRAHDRFLRVLWMAILGLTVSGVYTWMRYETFYKSLGWIGHALIGTKVLVALIMFALVFARSIGLLQPKNPRTLPMINLHLAAVVMLLACVLRYYHDIPR